MVRDSRRGATLGDRRKCEKGIDSVVQRETLTKGNNPVLFSRSGRYLAKSCRREELKGRRRGDEQCREN